MIAYKTSGDWTDVTSIGRNEVVFEGRNKEYGAYAVRQRYNSALLLSLFISASVGVLCATVPFVWNYFHKAAVTITKVIHFDAHPKSWTDPVRRFVVPPPPAAPAHPRVEIPRNAPPRIVANTPIDPLPDPKPVTTNSVVTGPANPNPGDPNPGIPGGDPNTKIIEEPKIEKPLPIVEIMPSFKGDMQKYFNENVIIPEFERSENIQGTVYLTFVVEQDGSITDVKIMRGVAGGPGYDKEAIRLVEAMPKWNPGMQGGHAVRVQFNLPVHFTYKP